MCSVWNWRISLGPTGTDTLRNRSGNIWESRGWKLRTKWGLFPEWSPSWSGVLCLSVPQLKRLRPKRCLPHSDRLSRKDSLSLHWDSFRKTKKKSGPQVSHTSAVRKTLWQLKQNRFCWPFSSWQAIAVLQISTTTATEHQNCPNPSPQQCLPSMGNRRNLDSLKICSKKVSRSTISSRNRTKYYFHSLMRCDALQMFKNNSSPNRENLGEILTVFRREKVKSQLMAAAKHEFQQIVFNPPTRKYLNFGGTPKISKRCFRSRCPSSFWAIHSCQTASTPEKIYKPSALGGRNLWANCVASRKKLELNNLEAPDELQINTVTQSATWVNPEKHKPKCHLCKKTGHCRQLRRKKDQNEGKKIIQVKIIAVAKQTLTLTTLTEGKWYGTFPSFR